MLKFEYEYIVTKLIIEASILYFCMCQSAASGDGNDSQSFGPKGAFDQRLVKTYPTEKMWLFLVRCSYWWLMATITVEEMVEVSLAW